MKNILVTGANGLIGRSLLFYLSQNSNFKVKAQVRNKRITRQTIGSAIDLTKIDLVEADYTLMLDHDYDNLVEGIDTVIHCGGLVHKSDATFQEFDVINIRATNHLAQACAKHGVENFVFLSTSGVYGNGPFNFIKETDQLQPVSPYASSKAQCEQDLQKYRTLIKKILIFRIGLVYGPGDRGNLLNLIREVKNNRYHHIGKADALKSMIYSYDCARNILKSITKIQSNFDVFNLADKEPVKIYDLTELIAKTIDPNKKIQSLPQPLISFGVKAVQALLKDKSPVSLEQINKITTSTTLDVSKLASLIDIESKYNLQTGLKNEIQWALAQNLL